MTQDAPVARPVAAAPTRLVPAGAPRPADEDGMELPRQRPSDVPADVFAVPDTSPEREALLRDAVARGSATAGHALGILLAAHGRLDAARGAWTQAAERGSAEAAYLLACDAYARDGEQDAYGRAVERADRDGSLLAAFALAAMADPTATGADGRWTRAVTRARERDDEGSADAAVLLAQVHQARGDAAEAVEAWKRAEQRGVPSATLGLASTLLASGDAAGAEAAARRGELAGLPAASLLLAGLLQQRREWKESHRALLTAAERAGAAGDWATVRAVTTVLDHVTLAHLRRHPLAALGVVLALVLIGALGGWAWAVASTVTLLLAVLAAKPALRGMPVAVQDRAPASVSLLGIAVSGRLGMVARRRRQQAPALRPATARDLRFWRLSLAVLAIVALSCWPWATGWWSGEVVRRIAFGGAAVLVVLTGLWRWPEDAAAPPSDHEDDSDAGVELRVSFSPMPFLTTEVRLAVTDPVFWPLVPDGPAASAAEPRLSRLSRAADAAPSAVMAMTFAVLAAAPADGKAARALVTSAAFAVEVVVVLGGLVAAVRRGRRGLRDGSAVDVLIAVAVAGAVALVVAATVWLGLHAQLVRVVRGLW